MDISAIKRKLNSLQNQQKKSDKIWKPTPGKHQVRIVPYLFNKDNPFIELFFHYNINNKTYLSPASFGRPDPIIEFADKLKKMGDKEDWKAARQLEPRLRTFVPVIIRGEEGEGVRFWSFGKTVYQEILGYIADPDYGDITDPKAGRDLTIEYISAEDAGTSYPTTTIRVKPKESPISEDAELAKKWLNEQTDITTIYSELSYNELKGILASWLNPETKAENAGEETDTDDDKDEEYSSKGLSTKTVSAEPAPKVEAKAAKVEVGEAKPDVKLDDLAAAFDKLF
jgi:hypothetical protein